MQVLLLKYWHLSLQRKFSDRASRDHHGNACARSYQSPLVGSGTEVDNEFHLVNHALDNAAELYRLTFPESSTFQIDDLQTALINKAYITLTTKIQNQISANFKYFISLFSEFYLASDTSSVTEPPIVFRSEPFQVFAGMDDDNLKLQLEQIYNNFILQIEEFCCRGSGHVISKFIRLDISSVAFDPTRTGSYLATPKKYAHPRCGLLNIRNTDEKCLQYALIAWDQRKRGIVPEDQATRVTNYIGVADTMRWILDG